MVCVISVVFELSTAPIMFLLSLKAFLSKVKLSSIIYTQVIGDFYAKNIVHKLSTGYAQEV